MDCDGGSQHLLLELMVGTLEPGGLYVERMR